jgi:GNAT superfamily N-acetyltransferase
MLSDADQYQRGLETLIASWQAYASCAIGASVQCHPGVTAAIFPCGPERDLYNNAILARDLDAPARARAIETMRAAYAAAGVDRFAAWVHEADRPMASELERRGYTLDTTTRAMGIPLLPGDMHPAGPELDLRPLDWSEYLRVFDLPPGLLARGTREGLHVVVAFVDHEPSSSALTFDVAGDCGIYNVATLEHARRRGLASALTTHLLHAARARGCESASLQSTPMAERVYAAVGFRDFGQCLEYVPSLHQAQEA